MYELILLNCKSKFRFAKVNSVILPPLPLLIPLNKYLKALQEVDNLIKKNINNKLIKIRVQLALYPENINYTFMYLFALIPYFARFSYSENIGESIAITRKPTITAITIMIAGSIKAIMDSVAA